MEDALRLDVLVQGFVPDGNGGFLDGQAGRSNIEIIARGKTTRVATHGYLVTGNQLSIQGVKAHVVGLVDTVHGLSASPGDVGEEDVFVVRKDLDQSRAVVHTLAAVTLVAIADLIGTHIAFLG